jgi:hypothetical protein
MASGALPIPLPVQAAIGNIKKPAIAGTSFVSLQRVAR